MNKSPNTGYGDNLTVFGTRIGDLSPKEHEEIEMNKGGFNYQPLENVVVSHVKDSSTLICRKPSNDDVNKYIEEEVLDGLCCYSAVNQGQLNQTIVNAVVQHLTKEKLPITKEELAEMSYEEYEAIRKAAEEKAKGARIAFLASRTNTMLSIPMLMSMVGAGHGFFM